MIEIGKFPFMSIQKKLLKKCFTLLALTGIYSVENAYGQPIPLNAMPLLLSAQNVIYCDDMIEAYFKNFEALAKAEQWEEIIAQGSAALEAAKKSNRSSDEAKICAQLTSTAFYMGDYDQALIYATRCHELAEKFDDPALFIRALYLESAIYRALAAKEPQENPQQLIYAQAVGICEEAADVFSKMDVENFNLKGKIYFNLGAAHADNPKGDLEKAENCYAIAIESFKKAQAADDMIRTTMRLGKVYLLLNDYEQCQQMINEVRPLISSQRLSMHADYLEAQVKFAINDLEEAFRIASMGLEKAKILGAKEDESRLIALLNRIDFAFTKKPTTPIFNH